MVKVRPTQWKATMQERPVFNPDADYSRDLAAGIRQARVPRKERFCLAEDADSPGGICAERAGRIMNEAIGFLYFAGAHRSLTARPARSISAGTSYSLIRAYTPQSAMPSPAVSSTTMLPICSVLTQRRVSRSATPPAAMSADRAGPAGATRRSATASC